jgi:hypothetical protein
VKRLLAAALSQPGPPGYAALWLDWRRRHQARSRWFHQRTRLARNYPLVSADLRGMFTHNGPDYYPVSAQCLIT